MFVRLGGAATVAAYALLTWWAGEYRLSAFPLALHTVFMCVHLRKGGLSW